MLPHFDSLTNTGPCIFLAEGSKNQLLNNSKVGALATKIKEQNVCAVGATALGSQSHPEHTRYQSPSLPAKLWSIFQGGIWLEGSISEPCQEDDIVQVLKQPEPAQLILVLWCLYGVGCNKLMDRSAGKMNFLPLSIYSSNECLQEPVSEAHHLPNHFIFTTRSLHSLLLKGVEMGHHLRWGFWV